MDVRDLRDATEQAEDLGGDISPVRTRQIFGEVSVNPFLSIETLIAKGIGLTRPLEN